MDYNIRTRLFVLGKSQVDLLCAIRAEGIPEPYKVVTAVELSLFIRGKENPPKSTVILALSDKIISRWEVEANAAS